jgi:hypothetical protein
MSLLNRIKAGARVAPALLIIIYYLFVALDMYTTYLASPDLKYEGNWIVRHFDLNWGQIIFFAISGALLLSSIFLIALNYIHIYFEEHNLNSGHSILYEIFNKIKLILSFLLIGYFYKHLFYSIFVTINNYLSYIYLYRLENSLSKISTWYINKEIMYIHFFFPIAHVLFYIIAFTFTAYKLKNIRNKYRTIPA